jgi:GDPmannose 4,6-dehydratase
MSKKKALITGISGQDGSYLAELLLSKNYEVSGILQRTTHYQLGNIEHIQNSINLFSSDITETTSLEKIFKAVKPDEIYHLAAQSSPNESFKQPITTSLVTGVGTQHIFEIVKTVCPKAKVYQASSSEMFGWATKVPQNERTSFNPANPYAAAKTFAHLLAKIYRESYGIFISCGILFNHESPRRGLGFVTQKIAYAAACAKLGINDSKHLNEEGEPIIKDGKVAIGNLHAKRDWGFAKDYVEAMWMMLQQDKPMDLVIATGEAHTVKELCKEAFAYVGLDFRKYIKIDSRFIRPTETGPLVGDASRAKKILGWKPTVKFKELVGMMVDANVEKLLA